MPPIIDIQQISKTFNGLLAVDNLSLAVSSREIFGFLGPNGSGKSTTLRILLTLLYPDAGTVNISGKNVFKDRTALNDIGFIIEKPDFYNYLSAIDNLKLFARMRGVDSSTTTLYALLDRVGLKGREKDKLKTYSHGMKQRIGLAQALLHNPSIIILDEPNTGLDPQGIIELRNMLHDLNKNEGKTILLSSHILSEIEEIADSMIVINKGKTIAQGKVNMLLNAEQLNVKLETNNFDTTQQLIAQSAFSKKVTSIENNIFHMELSNTEIAALNKMLVEQNIGVTGINKTRGLEEYFLKITQTH